MKLLWGTANLFSNPRYMNGAGTNPDVHTFAYAGAQVKRVMALTHKLGGENYVFWGGREGYQSLLNTSELLVLLITTHALNSHLPQRCTRGGLRA